MRKAKPFRMLHSLRMEDVMRYSSRVTLALAMLEEAAPDPVPVAAFREAFGSTAAETSHVLLRMRTLGLVERLPSAEYRLTKKAEAMSARVAAVLLSPAATAARI